MEGVNQFGLNLLTLFNRTDASKNLFFSPFSIAACLALVGHGGAGKTREQIFALFHTSEKLLDELLGPLFQPRKDSSVVLNIANAAVLKPSFGNFLAAYESVFKELFQAEKFVVDAGLANKVNEWVAAKTQGKIPQLVTNDVDKAEAVFLNAIYFQGAWSEVFEESATSPDDFLLENGTSVQVPFMHQTKSYKFLKADVASLLEIPYADPSMSAVFVLPNENIKFSDAISQVINKAPNLLAALDKVRPASTRISIPKFSLESSFELSEPCKTLGMNDAFLSSAADFSAMCSASQGLYISSIIHKATLTVNEEGTVAAAATAVVMLRSIAPPPQLFLCNRPFFMIVRAKHLILFLAQVTNPLNK